MPAAVSPAVAVDTSVAVPLVLRNHDAHAAVVRWRAGRTLSICGYAWIETYAVLTRLPGTARLSPADAVAVLRSNFSPPLAPGPSTLVECLGQLSEAGIAGGATYDAWVALAALDNGALLASRDARAETTYRRMGANVVMIT